MAAFICKQISEILYKIPSPVLTRGCSRNFVALYRKNISSSLPIPIDDTLLLRGLFELSYRNTMTVSMPLPQRFGGLCFRKTDSTLSCVSMTLPRSFTGLSFRGTDSTLHCVFVQRGAVMSRGAGTNVGLDQQDCWKCGKSINVENEQYFCRCGVVQPPVKKRSLFQILGVTETFDVDTRELTEKYRDLQRLLHPDKYSQKCETEKTFSIDHSTLVNKAYTTLLKPLTRGLYLLRLREEDLEKELDMSPDFLSHIMELNESLLEAEEREEVERLGAENQRALDELVARVSAAFKSGDLRGAKELLLQVKYFDNINEKFKERITWFNEKQAK